MLTRADLWWTLSAVLPHCKDHIGITFDGVSAFAWGTDNYTVGVVKVPAEGEEPCTATLYTGEALRMMRYVRPERKAHETQRVRVLTDGGEIHLGFYDMTELPFTLLDSGVYALADDVRSSATHLGLLRSWFRTAYARQPLTEMIYDGALLTRFDKAVTRGKLDRVRFYPRAQDERHGVALVTVGDRFIGAISALTYDTPGVDIPNEWLKVGGYEQEVLW